MFGRVSLVWDVFLLVRAGLLMVSLSSLSIDGFVAISFVTGAPLMAALLSWSVRYGRRGFERSEEFGWAFAEVAEPEPV